jgi:hypothetical protein
LSHNTTYYWQVRALNAIGYKEANAGAWWNFFVQITPPAAFTKINPANGANGEPPNPTLIWNASGGATLYEYCYDMNDNNTCDSGWVSNGSDTSVGLSGLSAGAAYYWQVRARNGGGISYADNGAWWRFVVGTLSGDSYEPDNTPEQANWMTSGANQVHSLSPASDVDWVKFTVDVPSNVVIETSGSSGNTRMALYDSSMNPLEVNDDIGGGNLFSRIDRICGVDALIAGTYYVKIDEPNGLELANYQLSLTITPCNSFTIFLPVVTSNLTTALNSIVTPTENPPNNQAAPVGALPKVYRPD